MRTLPPRALPPDQTTIINLSTFPPLFLDPEFAPIRYTVSTDAAPPDVNSASRQFSGDDVVVLPNSLLNGVTGLITIEFWFSTTNRNYQTVLSGVSATNATQFEVGIQGNKIIGSAGGTGLTVETIPDLASGQPHHVAVVLGNFAGGGFSSTVYLDGAYVWGLGFSPPFPSAISVAGIVVGQHQNSPLGGYTTPFIGKLDELRVWTGARTEADISRDMSRRLTGSEANLRAAYTFDDAKNSAQARDISPNAFHGVYGDLLGGANNSAKLAD